MASMWSTAIVVGASSGMGAALARELAMQGCRVALVARREHELAALCAEINAAAQAERAIAYPHDVENTTAVPVLFQEITTELGGLDLIIYATGILPRDPGDCYDTASDLRVLRINTEGAIAWLNEAARRFSRARAGTIVGISSVAGDRGRRPNAAYGASKAALNTYLDTLYNRLSGLGIAVVTIKPGYVATPMIAGAKLPRMFPVIDATTAAQRILQAAAQKKRVAYVPDYWRWVMLVVRIIPAVVFRLVKS